MVVRFDVTGGRGPHRYWLVADRTGAEVCIELPGLVEDGIVATPTAALIEWYAGARTIGGAHHDEAVTVTAPPWLERELARWGQLNPYAGIPLARFDPDDLEPGTGLATASKGPARRAAAARARAHRNPGPCLSRSPARPSRT